MDNALSLFKSVLLGPIIPVIISARTSEKEKETFEQDRS